MANDPLTAPGNGPNITVQQMCERHRYALLHDYLDLGPGDAWMAREVGALILLFQGASADDRIWKRAEGKAENLSLVLGEIGCLACWDSALFGRVARVAQKGLAHCAAVTQGRIADEGFDFTKPHREA